MRIFRIENNFHFGPFVGPSAIGLPNDQQLDYRKDFDFKFTKRCPPSNYHVHGFDDRNQVTTVFNKVLDYLRSNDYHIAEYEVSEFEVMPDGCYCFDLTTATKIEYRNIPGRLLDIEFNLNEFMKYATWFALDMKFGFPEVLCENYIIRDCFDEAKVSNEELISN